ncbi:MAG: hypothetical protein ACYDHD_00110 [Vulcanimicrobiaceae bacterium]
MGKRTQQAQRPHRELVLEQLVAYRDLLDRAIAAVKVSHTVDLHAIGDYGSTWSRGALEDAILRAHLWPIDEDQQRFYSRYSMTEAIPAPLIAELLATPPSAPPATPDENDHSRPWVCFLEHQAPEPESREHDELLANARLYTSRRACPVFRLTRAEHLLAHRKRAQDLAEKHGCRFPIDQHGRISIPATIPNPTTWIEPECLHLHGKGAQRITVGELDDYGNQLDHMAIVNRTPEERIASRAEGQTNFWWRTTEDGTTVQDREVFDGIATLTSCWTWIEPTDAEHVAYSRVPLGGIIQRLSHGRPGNITRVTKGPNGGRLPNLDRDVMVVYRRQEALPGEIVAQLGGVTANTPKTTPAPIRNPVCAPGGLFDQA